MLAGTEQVLYVNQSPDTLRDFYLHLYLNAFRPGSRWSDRDSVEGLRRFNDLKDPDFGFNHVRQVKIRGAEVTPEFPYAPDSTIARFRLPAPLAPGDSMIVTMAWDARPSTVARRQGRDGRRFDFAQWYPRVVVFDRYGWEDNPLNVAGEFYGEFGIFDVTLDVPQDEVIGATGVPIEGDPGWERAKADPSIAVDLQRGWYDRPNDPATGRAAGCSTMTVADGRKCVRFYAADVHHFAMSFNPAYTYEQGRFNNIVVRVLYQPGDKAEWGNGVAVHREEEALRWLDSLFGPYPWPQITNVHRIEGGGTEFPMMVMNGSAGLGLILHESGHNYLMGILANNEWKEGWLDEGFTSFQTTWYFEEHQPGYDGYYGNEDFILGLDLDGWSEPVNLPGHMFRDFNSYNVMTYTKGELFYHQVRSIVGRDMMRRILREYYRRYALKHVDERAFLTTAEDVSGVDLKPLFAQWLHGTPLYDYAMGKVNRKQLPDGSWRTSVEVKRLGDGIYPVEIGERSERSIATYARADGRPREETVTFQTRDKPGPLMIDPFVQSHDWNFENNYERRGFLGAGPWLGVFSTPSKVRLDDFLSEPFARDQAVESIAPEVWYNDVAGLTVGLRQRQNYLGRFDQNSVLLEAGFGSMASSNQRVGFSVTLANPTALQHPRVTEALTVWRLEGVAGVRATVGFDHSKAMFAPAKLTTSWTLLGVNTTSLGFRDSTLWNRGGTMELTHRVVYDDPGGPTSWHWDLGLTGGLGWSELGYGVTLGRNYDAEPFGRFTTTMSTRHQQGALALGLRLFGAFYEADDAPLKQRAIPVSGADPYETFDNPFVRSPGALFVRPGVFYHSPGNGNLRGYAANLGGRGMLTASGEVEAHVVTRAGGVLRRAGLVAFADGGLVDTLAVPSTSGSSLTPLADAGAGVRFALHLGDLNVPLRFEVPLWLSRPAYAQDTRQGVNSFQFRWLFSLEKSF
ncbi:MAG TPA: M1 family aminopeptidase [Gemmatimonadales bacterium]